MSSVFPTLNGIQARKTRYWVTRIEIKIPIFDLKKVEFFIQGNLF
jgi:hypothetical protein